jgi:hypothetical protein
MRPIFVDSVLEGVSRKCINDFFRQAVPIVDKSKCEVVASQSRATSDLLPSVTVPSGNDLLMIRLWQKRLMIDIIMTMYILVCFNGIPSQHLYASDGNSNLHNRSS